MRVLLVQSYSGRKEDFSIFPLGLTYIATVINDKGHEVKIFDPNVVSHPYEDLKDFALSFSPNIVGISLRNIDNQLRIAPFYYYKFFQHTLETIKETCQNVIVIVGGPGFSMFPQKIMEGNPSIAYGIYLEGEESFPELIDNLNNPINVHGIYFRKEEKVVFSGHRPLPDFKKLPIPRRNFIDVNPYLSNIQSIGIQTKRGCPFKCTYCNYPQLNGDKLRIRDAGNVCDEIEYLISLNINKFMFADAIFNMPIEHAMNICNEIKRRHLKVNWSAYLDIRNATKDFLLLAMSAGCQDIVFSPDGVSQNALDGLNKGLMESDVQNSLDLFKTDNDLKNLNVIYSIFINPPGETFRGLIKTIFFYLKARFFLRGRGTAFINWIRLEPGTKIFKVALEKGVVNESIELLPDFEKDLKKTFYSNPPLKYFDFFLLAIMKSLPLLKSIMKKSNVLITRLKRIVPFHENG